MKKLLLATFFSGLSISLIGCGGGSTTNELTEPVVTVIPEEYSAVIRESDFEDKIVILSGKGTTIKFEFNLDNTFLDKGYNLPALTSWSEEGVWLVDNNVLKLTNEPDNDETLIGFNDVPAFKTKLYYVTDNDNGEMDIIFYYGMNDVLPWWFYELKKTQIADSTMTINVGNEEITLTVLGDQCYISGNDINVTGTMTVTAGTSGTDYWGQGMLKVDTDGMDNDLTVYFNDLPTAENIDAGNIAVYVEYDNVPSKMIGGFVTSKTATTLP